MNLEEIKKNIEETLMMTLEVDSPETLYKQAARIESFAYLAVKFQYECERNVTAAEKELRDAGINYKNFVGPQAEKKASFDAAYSGLYEKVDLAKAEFHYWYNVGKTIERKIILSQSILSNISASMKSGIRVDG